MRQTKTIAATAKALKISTSTIAKALRNGYIEREQNGDFNLVKVRQGVEAQASRRGGQSLGGQSGGMPAALVAIKSEQAQEELRLTRAKRKKAEQELARDAGEFIPKGEALRAWMALMLNFRDQVLRIPDQVAMRCDKKPAREIAKIIREALEGALRALAEGGARVNGILGKKDPKR